MQLVCFLAVLKICFQWLSLTVASLNIGSLVVRDFCNMKFLLYMKSRDRPINYMIGYMYCL